MNVIKKATHPLLAAAALIALSCDPPSEADSVADIGVDSESEGVESETGPAAVSGEVFDDFARPDSEALGRTPVGGWLWVPAEEPAVLQGETLHASSPDGTRGGQAGGGAKLQGFTLRDGRLTADVALSEGGLIRARLGDLELELELGRLSAQGTSQARVEVELSESPAGSLEVALEGGLVSVWLGEAQVLGPFEAAYAGGEVELWVQADASIDTFGFVPSSDEEEGSRGGGGGSPVRAAGSDSVSASRGDTEPAGPGGAPTFSAPGDGGGGGGDGGGEDVVEMIPDPLRLSAAPAPDLTTPTTLFKMVEFLYTGAGASQLDVGAGVTPPLEVLPPASISLVHGFVRDEWGQAVAGAEVFVRGKPEYGYTLTRTDGTYDLVIAGGRATDVVISHTDYLSVQRSTEVEVGDSDRLDDVVLLEVDVESTPIAFVDPIEVHHSFTLNDGWSDRMTTLMFRAGTQATMVYADGTTDPLASMTVRTTEFTVGEEGQDRMPAKLPPGTAYSYALEISADEAESAGAVSVELDTPAALYVDNFRNFPVGAYMPNGSFGREDGRWHAEPTGIVLEVLDIVGGVARLDLTGDGVAADAAALSEFGITLPEQEELGSIYNPGAELWRVEIQHFTPFDVNPSRPQVGVPPLDGNQPEQVADGGSCEVPGSIIEVESRVLGESIPLAGTPFSLEYRSSRVPGGPNYSISVPINDPDLPADIARMALIIEVAGRRFIQTRAAAPSLRFNLSWDGLDAYGRAVQGPQPMTLCVAYGFPSPIVVVSASGEGGGGGGGGGTGAAAVRFGQWSEGAFTIHLDDAGEYEYLAKCYGNGKSVAAAAVDSITKADRFRIGGLDASLLSDAVGGWTLDVHHTLSRATATLHRGDGRDRELADEAVMTASRFAGVQEEGEVSLPGTGDLEGENPAAVLIPEPTGLAAGPDGSIYVATAGLVRRIAPDGVVAIVAGTSNLAPSGTFNSGSPTLTGFDGDGGPAVGALLGTSIESLAVDEDGGLYIADGARLRYVDPEGTIDTIAGGGSAQNPAERHPDPLAVNMTNIRDVALLPNGDGIVIATSAGGSGARAVRLLTKDGELEFLAGSPSPAWVDLIDGRLAECTPGLCSWDYHSFGPINGPHDWIPAIGPWVGAGDGMKMGRSIFAAVNNPLAAVAVRDGRVFFAERAGAAQNRRIRQIQGYRGGKISSFRRRYRLRDEPVVLPFVTANGGFTVDTDANGVDEHQIVLDRDVDPHQVEDLLPAELGLYYTTPETSLSDPGGLYFAPSELEDPPERLMGGPGATRFVGGDGVRLADSVALGVDTDIVRGKDDAFYIADRTRNVILRVARMVPPMYLSSWVTSADGSQVFLFDEEGRHLETREAKTHALIYAFGYDANGLLVSVTDAFNDVTVLHRSGEQITGIQGPDGHLTSITLDANGFIDTITDPSLAETDIEHGPTGLLESMADSDSLTEFEYDLTGALLVDQQTIAYEDPDGVVESDVVSQGLQEIATADPKSGMVQHTTADDLVSFYSYERNGSSLERRVTFPDSTANMSTHSPEQDEVTYADGTVVTTRWEADERLGANTRAPASIRIQTPGAIERIVTFDREFDRRCTVHTEDLECQSGQPAVELPNLRADRITETTQSGTEIWRQVYDRAHLDGGTSVPATIVNTAASGRVTTTTLNGDGQVASLQVGSLAPVIYSYDSRGRVSGISQTDGLEVRGVTFGYHATEGWLETVTDSHVPPRTTTFQRDELGRVLQQIAPNTEVVSFTYDEDGNVESVTPPSRPAHEFFYDSADRLREYAPPTVSGVTDPETQYTYTPDHKPEVTSLPQSSDITYEHDGTTGKLSTVTTPEALYAFIHDDEGGPDDTGQLQSVSINPTAAGLATNTLTYTYDGDLLTGEALTGDVNGSVTWGYDSQLRVDAETAAGDTVAYGYDSQGRMDSMGAMTATYVPTTGQLDTTTLSGVLATYSYDPFGDLAGILYEDGATAVYEVTYTRDSYGRIETKTETHSGSANLRCYEYDDADRLADVYDAADSMGCTGTNLESYSYDANGNRNAVTNSAGTTGVGGIVTDNQDRLLTHGDWTYTYNENGQMTSRTETSSGDVWLYTYDAVGNLLEVDPPGVTGTIRYIIDPRNRRVGKRVDGVLVQQFLYGDQLNPIAELDGAGALVSRFVYGTSDHVPDYMVRGGTTYRFLTDQKGNVVGVFNTTTNTMAQTREYDAYGRVVGGGTTEVGFSQPFGFAGGLYDEDTGLVRFGARDYRPEVGSWAAKDPLRFGGGSGALFAYCLGDPANFVDIAGTAPSLSGSAILYANSTWGSVQTVAGLVFSAGANFDYSHSDDGIVVVRDSWIEGILLGRNSGLTIGPFVFLNECDPERVDSYYEEVPVWEHERGHVIQSALTGPFYLQWLVVNYGLAMLTPDSYYDGSPMDRNANDLASWLPAR